MHVTCNARISRLILYVGSEWAIAHKHKASIDLAAQDPCGSVDEKPVALHLLQPCDYADQLGIACESQFAPKLGTIIRCSVNSRDAVLDHNNLPCARSV